MANYLSAILKCFKVKKNLTLILAVIFILGVILGVVLSFNEDFACFYKNFLFDYFNRILSRETFGVSYLFKRVLSLVVLFLVVALLSLNKYTFYVIFLILFYRAYIIGLAFKLFLSELLISGMFFFLFLVLVSGFFTSLAIAIFICFNYCKSNVNNLEFTIKTYLFSLSVAVIGAILEFIFIVAIFRPFNFNF